MQATHSPLPKNHADLDIKLEPSFLDAETPKNLFGTRTVPLPNTLHIANSSAMAPTPDFQANRIDINRAAVWTSRPEILQPSPVRAAARIAAEAS